MKSWMLGGLFCLGCAAQELQVYAVDVEGGKSTLYVSPSGESMLMDAGYGGFQSRDAKRIVVAAHAAGVKQIDYLVVTHYHKDHVGGVPQLAALIPIRTFVDHGQNFESVKDNGDEYQAYLKARAKARHLEVKAGDRIPIQGIDVQVFNEGFVMSLILQFGSAIELQGLRGFTKASQFLTRPTLIAHAVLLLLYSPYSVLSCRKSSWNCAAILVV